MDNDQVSSSVPQAPPRKRARAGTPAVTKADSPSGGAAGQTGADTVVVNAPLERPIHIPTVTMMFSRRMRYYINNTQITKSWVQSTQEFPFQYTIDGFYELPINHVAFFMTGHESGVVGNFNAWKIHYADWTINSIQALTIKENNPAANAITYEPASNITPSFQIWQHDCLPPNKNRYWDIARDGAISVLADTPDATSVKVATQAAKAEAYEANLPQIVFGVDPRNSTDWGTTTFMDLAGENWLINRHAHTINPGGQPYSGTCQIEPCWRRLRAAMQDPGGVQLTQDLNLHDWNKQYWTPKYEVYLNSDDSNKRDVCAIQPQYDFVGRDKVENMWYYRDASSGEDLTRKLRPNTPVFIRFEPLTSAQEPDDSNILNPILMKAYVDISTEMAVECSYEAMFMAQQSGRLNESMWAARCSPFQYTAGEQMDPTGPREMEKIRNKYVKN